MRTNYFMSGAKPHGVIIRRSQQKASVQQQRTLSLQHPILDYLTINSNDSIKIPGEIKRCNPYIKQKVDEQAYYNADVYTNLPKQEHTIIYSESQAVMPVKIYSKKIEITPVTNSSRVIQRLQSIQEEPQHIQLKSIHGDFDILKYNQSYTILSNILNSFSLSQFQLTASIAVYAQKVMFANLAEITDLKLVHSKKQIVKESFLKQRESIVLVCLTIVVGKLQKMRNYCSNLLKLAFQNYLICLYVLSENPEYVQNLMKTSGKHHLLGKGVEQLRTNNQIINDLMIKIIQVDPLFAQQYAKIKNNYTLATASSCLQALLSFFAFYINAYKAENIIPFLAVAPAPFISDVCSQEYTLVIDFMRVFPDQSSRKKKHRLNRQPSTRPYCSYFLKQVSKYYEIVSFCESMPIQCNKAINRIDEYGVVKHRLFKFHIDRTTRNKKINDIGRDGDRIILIDTKPSNDENLLLVNSWKGEPGDAQLAEICPLLAMIAVQKLPARASLQKIRQASRSLGLKYINCGISI